MYDEATARKILTAAKNMAGETMGFDPERLDATYHNNGWSWGVTPMIYFARKGDAKMCRYLISRGASTTKSNDRNHCFPMLLANQNGHLDVCKLLFENGAQNDVRRANKDNSTPFFAAAKFSTNFGHDQVLRWLTLHGALCADNNSEDVCVARARITEVWSVGASYLLSGLKKSRNLIPRWSRSLVERYLQLPTRTKVAPFSA